MSLSINLNFVLECCCLKSENNNAKLFYIHQTIQRAWPLRRPSRKRKKILCRHVPESSHYQTTDSKKFEVSDERKYRLKISLSSILISSKKHNCWEMLFLQTRRVQFHKHQNDWNWSENQKPLWCFCGKKRSTSTRIF